MPTDERRLLIKANLLFSILLGGVFLSLNSDYTAASFLMTAAGMAGTIILFYLVFWLMLLPFSWLPKTGMVLGAGVFVLFDLLLLTDFFIYRLYHTHINGMVLNILFSSAAAKNVDVGMAPYIAIGVIGVVLVLMQWGAMHLVRKAIRKYPDINRKLNRLLIPGLILFVLVEKVSFGFANLYAQGEIVQKMQVVPLYQPLTFNRLAHKWFGFEVEEQVSVTVKGEGDLDYPKSRLDYRKVAELPNILIIAMDAVRWDMVDPETTPHLARLRERSVVFDNHYSGGNSTRFGVFSLFYGLHAPYWFSFLDHQRESVLFEALRHRGYEIGIFSSSDLNWPEFRKTMFAGIPESLHDQYEGKPWERDVQMNRQALEWLDERRGAQPFFGFLFFDATHQASYPEAHAVFKPDDEGDKNYLTLGVSKRDVLFNQYKNSIHFVDEEVGKVLALLKEKSLLKSTRIIVTADHGEEFFESGGFGHNHSFSEQQVKPLMMVSFPDGRHEVVSHMTSHADVVPTLMNWLGVVNPPSDYCFGQDLFADQYHRTYAVSGNWNNTTIITPEHKLVFSTKPSPVNATRVYDAKSYDKLPVGEAGRYGDVIMKVMQENRCFYQQ